MGKLNSDYPHLLNAKIIIPTFGSEKNPQILTLLVQFSLIFLSCLQLFGDRSRSGQNFALYFFFFFSSISFSLSPGDRMRYSRRDIARFTFSIDAYTIIRQYYTLVILPRKKHRSNDFADSDVFFPNCSTFFSPSFSFIFTLPEY